MIIKFPGDLVTWFNEACVSVLTPAILAGKTSEKNLLCYISSSPDEGVNHVGFHHSPCLWCLARNTYTNNSQKHYADLHNLIIDINHTYNGEEFSIEFLPSFSSLNITVALLINCYSSQIFYPDVIFSHLVLCMSYSTHVVPTLSTI